MVEVSNLVTTLITGLLASIAFLFLVYCFWKLYDRPSRRQIEVLEEKREKFKETKMWQAVEAEMAAEREHAEALAIIQRQKAEERARAMPPAAQLTKNALAALDAPTEGEAFLERFKPKENAIEEVAVKELLETEIIDDSDVLLAPELVEVRQDAGLAENEILEQLLDDDEAVGHEASSETEIEESAEPESETQEATPNSEQDALDDEDVKWQGKDEQADDDTWAVGW
ncbi:MAG TPA: hypothetical protein D7H99_02500 [Candidatus Poseidoniales archaeon]|nr:MAG TPA: hypothetical protein D7H99_02500 [Candidatus Poseidoniales archaeon]HII57803.1 hypothetical protein [Candidatus Poseidoniaceae archaeon]|tara:strand:- start:2024 stop:2707 length:684 start_codon:yes stop_codon:yes gene_type:complete